MAPARPYWKGYLKLSLVSCPVAVYTATSSSERVAFRQINKKTGNRLKQQLVDEDTGEVVQTADKGRGYEVAKQTYLAIEDDEIDAIAIESNHTIDIGSFVPRAQIEERFLRKSGEAFWVNVNVGPIRDHEGRLLYTLGVIEDIDERKRMTQALEDSERRLRELNEELQLQVEERARQLASTSADSGERL